MNQLPKAIRDVMGELWVPEETANLLERVLRDVRAGNHDPRVMQELERLLGFDGSRNLPSAYEILGLLDEKTERLGSGLLRG